MKKYIRLLLLFVFIISLFGCQSTETESEEECTDEIVSIETLEKIGKTDSDYFVGKVLSAERLKELACVNVFSDEKGGYVYEVEVTEEIWAVNAKQGETVRVAQFGDRLKLTEGKTYLISGRTQISNVGVVILDCGFYTSLIKENGELIRLRKATDGAINSLKKLDEFKNAEPVKRLMKTEPDNLPACFYMEWVEKTPIRVTDGGKVLIEKGEKQHPRDEVLGYVREAIKKGSSIKIEAVMD